jgi:outer membrane protein assembly factor BamD
MIDKIFFTIFLFFLFSCSTLEKEKNPELYYNQALINIKNGNLISAKDNLDIIESDYPYSNYTVKAEILNGFINFLNKEYDLVIANTEKFIKLRPANKYVDYMLFLRAEAYYHNRSDYLREQNITQNAEQSFLQLIARFPEKKYTKYVQSKLKSIKGELANYHLDIARSHIIRGEYVPAILKLEAILTNYNNTIYIAETKYRLMKAYYALGIKDQALYYANLLAENNQDNIWYNKITQFKSLYLN